MNDIDILERFIKDYKKISRFFTKKTTVEIINVRIIVTAIQNLIARYNELQKEYKVLREYVSFAPNLDEMSAIKYKEICQSSYIEGRKDERDSAREIIEETCIPKSKIEEKIKELEKDENLINAEYFIKVLQSILEKE